MLNIIWGAMMVAGITYGVFSGNMEAVGNGIMEGSKEAISLAISMAGVVALWSGLMEIAKTSGIVQAATKVLRPLVKFMFPKIPEGDEALEHITVNIISNIFGLGAAATPAGLKAMNALERLEEKRCEQERLKGIEKKCININYASNEMCTFLVLNISSLQLIPVNMIAYRGQYGSVNPMIIVGPAIIATFASTLAAVIFSKIMCSLKKR